MSAQPAPLAPPLPVTFLLRHPIPGWHSIETVFATVDAHLSDDVEAVTHVSPRPSTGFRARLLNLRDALGLRRRPGVLHVTGDVHYLALVLPGRRTVLTVHDLGTLASGGRLRRALIALLWFHLPVRHVAHVTTVSEATRDALVELIPSCADKITVVPNPLPADLHPRKARAPATRPVVLAVGSTPNKNLHRLVEAVGPLPVHLVVIGTVSEELRTVLLDAGVATIESHADLAREDLVAHYVGADVLAFVSTSEGFGLPVIEAQAIGLPVVASRIAAIAEASGGAVRFVGPTDVDDIRAGIDEVLSDAALRDRLIGAGHDNVRRFDAGAIAARYSDVWRAVAGRGRPADGGLGRRWTRARA
jgi:glycosyltransferase involved in cell wall biosynthesis